MKRLVRVCGAMLSIAASLWLTACSSGEDGAQAFGTLEWDRYELVATAAEPIVEILATEGQRVVAGDIILRQDGAPQLARLRMLQAQRDQQQASLDELLRGPREEDIARIRAELAGAQGNLNNAAAQLKRVADMRQRKLAPAADLDRAQADYDQSLANRDAANKRLEEALNGATVEQLDQLRAALAAAEAAIDEHQIHIQRLTVRSPVDGLLEALPFETGEQPDSRATVAIVLGGSRPWARIYVPAPKRGKLSLETVLTVHVGGQSYSGRVRRISLDPVFTPYFALSEHDRDRLAYLVEVELEQALDRSLAGFPVQVDLNGSDSDA